MTAIYKREIKAYFQTVIGWIFIAVTVFLTGLYFSSVNLAYGSSNLAYTLSSVTFLFVISMPVLSMRILADEKKQKTDQLLLTSPISVWKIVMGKYFAMLTVFLIPVLIFALMPLIMSGFGEVAFMESYAGLFGYFLMGSACLAIGLFLSSITESQVIAAILSIAVLFAGYQMQGICYLISESGNTVTKILSVLDLYTPYSMLTGGTLDLKAVVYFVSLIVVCCFLTVQMIQKRRYTVSKKGFAIGAYSYTMIAITVAIAVFVNMAISVLPAHYTEFDMTDNKLYSITDITKNMLKNLDQDVTIYVLNSETKEDTALGHTLKQYEDLSSHIKIEYKDPVEYPDFYKEYTDGSVSLNSLIVVGENKSRVIDYSDCYETEIDYQTYSQKTTGYDGEGQLTSAIDYVTKDNLPKIYEITGHEEADLSTKFNTALQKANVETEKINLMEYDSVPDDAQAVIIMAPRSDYSKDDVDKILTYVRNGGKLIVESAYTENFAQTMPNFAEILNEFGFSLENGVVIENSRSNYYQNPLYLLPEVLTTDLTEGVAGKRLVFMPTAQSISVEEMDGVTTTALLKSSEDSYAKPTSNGNLDSVEESTSDRKGPFNLGMQAVRTYENGKNGELVLYASENIFTDNADAMVSGANMTLFTNAVAGAIDEESNVSIPSKSLEQTNLMVSQSARIQLTILFTALLPIIMIAAGIIIWLRRRKN